MENTSEIFKLIESADNLFQQGSIKEGQKLTRDINFQLKQFQSIPRKLLHKVNFIRAQSRYFDDISSFAANPKREKLIKEASKFIENTPKDIKQRANEIHDLQSRWQRLDHSSRPASRKQWSEFSKIIDAAWLPCGNYFNELNEIKNQNVLKKETLLDDLSNFINTNKRLDLKFLRKKLKSFDEEWKNISPVPDKLFRKLNRQWYETQQPIYDEIKKIEKLIEEKKNKILDNVELISNEDNAESIKQYLNLKKEWNDLGRLSYKIEKKLFTKFVKLGDRFFEEQNQMKQEQVDKIPEIYALLESKNLADAIAKLKDLHLIKDHKDYKQVSKAIKNFQQDIKRQQKKASTTAVVSMFDAIVNNQKIDQDLIPSSLQKVFSNNFDNRDKESMHEACIRIEILNNIDSLKKDQELRNKVQLQILNEKFNQKKLNKKDEEIFWIQSFFQNLSLKEVGDFEKKLWKRITKALQAN